MVDFPESWRSRPRRSNTVRYEREICNAVGLPHPDEAEQVAGRYLGTFEPAQAGKQAVAFVERWAKAKADWLEAASKAGEIDDIPLSYFPGSPPTNPIEGLFWMHHQKALFEYNYLPLTFAQYKRNLREGYPKPLKYETGVLNDKDPLHIPHNAPRWERDQIKQMNAQRKRDRQPYRLAWYSPRDWRFIDLRGGENHPNPDDWTADEKGYLRYVSAIAPHVVEFLKRPVPACLPEKATGRHTYVTGSSGSGKTELLKLLIHGAITSEKSGVLVIDPHGDFAEQVARWPEFADGERLVYIDPFLSDEKTPCVNPFDIAGEGAASDALTVQEFVGAFEEMLTAGEGKALSVPMRNILMHTVPALMAIGGKSIPDLIDFMSAKTNVGLIEQARRLLPPDQASFFAGEFQSKQFEATRLSISTKLRLIMQTARDLFKGSSTVDIEAALNAKKVVVFNLSQGKMGAAASSAFGRFVIAAVQSMAVRRGRVAKAARVPVHVFVDECQNYISPSVENILTGARKYGLFLTLAQQQVGQDMGAGLKKAVLGNPKLKLSGINEAASYKELAASTHVSREAYNGLKDRQFIVSVAGAGAFKLDTASHLADESRAMSAAEWAQVVEGQLARYYRDRDRGDGTPPDDSDDEPTGGKFGL